MSKKRFELSLNPNYVSNWGVWEGLRELAQNTLDQHSVDPGKHPYSIHYDSAGHKMVFKNLNSKLSIQNLLMGSTSKSADKNQIGQFGEGFKLAFLVLLREGLYFQIVNGDEFWEPKIINSKRYNSRLLVVDVTSNFLKNGKDLKFVVYGVKPQMYADFANNFLPLDYPENIISTPTGNILLDEKYKSKIFVSGIYVGEISNENSKYGYDLSPGEIELDRDRKKVDSFNLFWSTSKLFSELQAEHSELVHKCIMSDAPEVEHIACFNSSGKLFDAVCELSHKDFLEKYGVKAVPVDNQTDADIIKRKYNSLVPVVVPKTIKHYVSGSESFRSSASCVALKTVQETPYKIIENFIRKNKQYIYGRHKKLIEDEILTQAANWKVR